MIIERIKLRNILTDAEIVCTSTFNLNLWGSNQGIKCMPPQHMLKKLYKQQGCFKEAGVIIHTSYQNINEIWRDTSLDASQHFLHELLIIRWPNLTWDVIKSITNIRGHMPKYVESDVSNEVTTLRRAWPCPPPQLLPSWGAVGFFVNWRRMIKTCGVTSLTHLLDVTGWMRD